MSSSHLVKSTASLISTTSDAQSSLIKSFFDGRNQQTHRVYRADLEDFKHFLKTAHHDEAVEALLARGPGHANQIAFAYRAHLIELKLQPATINRRLSTLRSLVAFARTLGVINWNLEVKNLKAQPYRDTRGPGQPNFERILAEATRKQGSKAIRDRAILRLLYDLALRASELINLNVSDVDLERSTIAILGKGRTQKEFLVLPEPTKTALETWLQIRRDLSGSLDALFLNFDRSNKGQSRRLTRNGLYQLVRGLGEKLSIKARPHGIRHTSITEACKLAQQNGFGIEEVLDHSRHANVSTLMIYRDRDEGVQGKIATLVANNVKSPKE